MLSLRIQPRRNVLTLLGATSPSRLGTRGRLLLQSSTQIRTIRLLKRNSDGRVTFTNELSSAETPKYAILSHTWGSDADEVTFNDILKGSGKGKQGYEKIQFCVKQTQRDGLDYFWLDTCCIDKTNNAELSEALNSMFRWYLKAEKCYTFLSDVSVSPETPEPAEGSVFKGWENDFYSSRWFRRGWTLQELIAPTSVEFFSRDGRSLGTRTSLEQEISSITKIPIQALRGGSLTDFTVNERLQWQEGRETKKEEDLVYSLLGLVEVSMPVLYGEGRTNARRRLENEIKNSQKGDQHLDFSLAFSLSEAVRTQHFVARDSELQEIRTRLKSDGSRRHVILHGLGGIGKTQLAIAYADRYKNDYSAILWLNTKDENSIRLSFARIAKQILREHPSVTRLRFLDLEKDLDEVVDVVKDWLSMPKNTRWLLICDNFDNPNVPGNTDPGAFDVRKFLPEVYQGSVLVTTRSSQLSWGHCMRIRKLEHLQDGITILEETSGRGPLSDDPSAVQLATKLDGLPLALTTAGAYLSQTSISFAKYLDFFEQSWAKLQRLSPALMTYENRTLYSTWHLSFEQIERRNALSANLLRWWGYFDSQDLWFELLAYTTDEDPQWMRDLTEDEMSFHAAMQVLCDHGLVEPSASTGSEVESQGYNVHACVHSWILSVLNAQQDDSLAKAAVRCVTSRAHAEPATESYLMRQRLLNHSSKSLTFSKDEWWGENVDIFSAYNSAGTLYDKLGKMAEAEEMYMRALRGYQQHSGPDNVATLQILNNLGCLYWTHGKLEDAERCLSQALEGREKVSGPEDEETLQIVNNLGALYKELGRLEKATEMHLRTLAGIEKVSEVDNVLTLATVNNMGTICMDLRKVAEAEELFIRALTGYEKTLGLEHTSTLNTMNNLGLLYTYHSRLYAEHGNRSAEHEKIQKAEDLFLKALDGYERIAGPEHISTLRTVANLGILYAPYESTTEMAEQMYLKALEGLELVLEPNHSWTLTTIQNLGALYASQGKREAAEEKYHRALDGFDKTLGPDHLSTLRTLFSLGMLYADSEETVEKAKEIYSRTLEGYTKRFGADFESTLDTANNLGCLYAGNNETEAKAEELLLQAIEGYEKVLGPHDPSTLRSVGNLAEVYAHQGKIADAENLYVRALDGLETACGTDHRLTLDTVDKLGKFYANLGETTKLEALNQRAHRGQDTPLMIKDQANASD